VPNRLEFRSRARLVGNISPVPAILAPFFGFALGVLFAWLTPSEHGVEGRQLPPLPVVASFAGLLYGPAVAFFVIVAPDWSLGYLLDASAVPSALLLIWIVMGAGLVVAGYLVAGRSVRRRAFRQTLVMGGAPALFGAAMLLILWPRFAVDASYRRFHGDFGVEAVAGGPLGFCILWVDTLLMVGLWMCARTLSERRRQPGRRLGAAKFVPPTEPKNRASRLRID